LKKLKVKKSKKVKKIKIKIIYQQKKKSTKDRKDKKTKSKRAAKKQATEKIDMTISSSSARLSPIRETSSFITYPNIIDLTVDKYEAPNGKLIHEANEKVIEDKNILISPIITRRKKH